MSAKVEVTTLIVEDEPLARRRLRELIRGVPWLKLVSEVSTGAAAITAIDELQPELVFLDVQLPGVSGLDVLARVQHAPAVIFTTAFDRFAVTAFELGALDYLLKPFGTVRFQAAIDRARPHFERRAAREGAGRAAEVLPAGPIVWLFVRDAGRIVPVRVMSIERLEACDDYVNVYAGGREFRINVALSDLAQRLDPAVFVRVHRSHIVNLDQVISWTPREGSRFQITLRSGATLMASRDRSRALRDLAQ